MIEKKKERKVQEWKQSGTPSKIPSKLFDVVLYIEKGGITFFLKMKIQFWQCSHTNY